MLRGIPDIIGSDLLKALADTGHGDLIVIADHFYPPYSKSFRGHAYGVYDAYVAMEYVPEWILDCEAGLSAP